MAMSGCGSQAGSSPRNVATKTVSIYVKQRVLGDVGDFIATRQRNGDWLVTFKGKFAYGGKLDLELVDWCVSHDLPAGTELRQAVYNAGQQLVSKNGTELVCKTTWHGTETTTTVECPASS
jgi:hypothetical protein